MRIPNNPLPPPVPREFELLRAETTARVKPSSSIALGAFTLMVTGAIEAASPNLNEPALKFDTVIGVADPTGTLGVDAATLGVVVSGVVTVVVGVEGVTLAEPLDGGMIDAPPNGRLAVGTLPVLEVVVVEILGIVETLGRMGIEL